MAEESCIISPFKYYSNQCKCISLQVIKIIHNFNPCTHPLVQGSILVEAHAHQSFTVFTQKFSLCVRWGHEIYNFSSSYPTDATYQNL